MNEIEANKSIEWAGRSESLAKFAPALSKVQAELEAVKKDSSNPFFKSKYADLSSVWDAIRGPLTKNGFSVIQEPTSSNGKVVLSTTLLHSSGEYVRSSMEIPVTKQDPQGHGSAITYARRYSLQAFTGVAPEDDDGEAASRDSSAPEPRRESKGSNPPPIMGDVIMFGKHKGTRWDAVNTNYLEWLSEQKEGAIRTRAMMELHRRTQNQPAAIADEDPGFGGDDLPDFNQN